MDIPSLIRSSDDPAKISLFVKGIVTLGILFGLDATVVNQAGSQIANLITGALMAVSAAMTLWGLVRKWVKGRWASPVYSQD